MKGKRREGGGVHEVKRKRWKVRLCVAPPKFDAFLRANGGAAATYISKTTDKERLIELLQQQVHQNVLSSNSWLHSNGLDVPFQPAASPYWLCSLFPNLGIFVLLQEIGAAIAICGGGAANHTY